MSKLRYFVRKHWRCLSTKRAVFFFIITILSVILFITIFQQIISYAQAKISNKIREKGNYYSSSCWDIHSLVPLVDAQIQNITAASLKMNLLENDFPLCMGNLLDQREYRFEKEIKSLMFMSEKSRKCRLLQYTAERVVACLDALHHQQHPARMPHKSTANPITPKPRLYFVFMGDSRIRQQFFNFLKLIPDYDQESQPSPLPLGYHSDIEVSSKILGLRISFKWRPLINDSVIETIRHWGIAGEAERPYMIVISMASWHMLQTQGADFKLYQKKLTELAPFLGKLTNFSQVIWLNQYPIIEKYGNTGAMNTDVFSEKIHHYNEAVRRIFQRYNNISIWDSSNSLVEEYIRSCELFHRMQFGLSLFIDPDHSYVACDDHRHPGYSALSQATQLLLNNMCNVYQVHT